MQSKTPLLMVTALICGLGAAFGTWKLVSSAQAAPSSDEVKIKVLVPVAEVQPYLLCQDEKKFITMDWPKHKLREAPEDTITSFDQIKNKQARHYKLRANEPIYKGDFCDSSESDITARLKPGEKAAAIRTDPSSAAGGFIQAGDRVDISALDPNSAGGAREFKFILSNVEVLAVDNLPIRGPDGTALPTNRLVLRLSNEDTLILKAFEESSGKLTVVKRRLDDTTDVRDVSFIMSGGRKMVGGRREEDVTPIVTQLPLETKPVADAPVAEVKTTTQKDGVTRTEVSYWDSLIQTLDDGTRKTKTDFNKAIEKKKIVETSGKDKDGKEPASKEDGNKKPDDKN